MVNFRDPNVMVGESSAHALQPFFSKSEGDWTHLPDSSDRFWSLMHGIFIWEFVNTLDYEWNVIRGRRPYRWTIWVYSLTRVATLASVALNIYSVDVAAPSPSMCQVLVILQFIFVYLAFATSSLLIVLRIIAIWDRKKIIVVFATGVWGINIGFLIQGVSRFRSSYEVENAISGCVFYLDSIRLSTIIAFATDTTLLLIMLFGLYRLRRHGHGGLMGLGRLLWNQGVVWLLLVIATELTPTVLVILNLNDVLDLTFQVPWSIAMSIAATRMYRSLSDFLSSDFSQKVTPKSGRIALEPNGTSTASILFTGIQVAVHTTHEQYSPQANNISGESPHGKPHELIVDHDIDGRAEK